MGLYMLVILTNFGDEEVGKKVESQQVVNGLRAASFVN